MFLVDKEIAKLAQAGMITPFKKTQARTLPDGGKAVSSGISSIGYDFSLGNEARILAGAGILDAKNFDISQFPLLEPQVNTNGTFFVIPPHAVMLGVTVEEFNIPRDIGVICVGKSTYARVGLLVNVTPFEPGWKGVATIELSNTGSMPLMVYVGEGMGQLLFFDAEDVEIAYGERPSAYQNQPNKIVGATL